jgi:hypothetical protein
MRQESVYVRGGIEGGGGDRLVIAEQRLFVSRSLILERCAVAYT